MLTRNFLALLRNSSDNSTMPSYPSLPFHRDHIESLLITQSFSLQPSPWQTNSTTPQGLLLQSLCQKVSKDRDREAGQEEKLPAHRGGPSSSALSPPLILQHTPTTPCLSTCFHNLTN